jgi:two-component system sensor histidine kinase KdpD
VGKTYHMLNDAYLMKHQQGVDVVIGLVETHGRKETETRFATWRWCRRR